MFGGNDVVLGKDIRKLDPYQVKVTSMFSSIQGEGPFQGTPAIFVRLAHCNLVCSFCDTFFDDGEIMSVGMCIDRVREKSLRDNKLVVITGGEPFLQRGMARLARGLSCLGLLHIQIESNGTTWLSKADEEDEWLNTEDITLVVSPKYNEKGKRWVKLNEKTMKRANYLKFVISADMEGYQDLPNFALKWAEQEGNDIANIFVSPMNCYARPPLKLGNNLEERSKIDEVISFWTPGLLDNAKNQRNHEHAARIAMKYGCRLTLQMQLLASIA